MTPAPEDKRGPGRPPKPIERKPVSVHVKVPADLVDVFDRLARRGRTNRHALVRKALARAAADPNFG